MGTDRTGHAGFSLIEVVVAVLVLAVGVLALGSVSASVSRLVGSDRLATEVSHAAGSVMEGLVATACDPGTRSGDTAAGPIDLSWRVVRLPSASVLTVTSTTAVRGIATDTLQNYVRCAAQ